MITGGVMPKSIRNELDLRPGDIYEDAFYHPCLCLGVRDGMAWGISLIDGSYDRNADLHAGSVRKLTLEEAWEWRRRGPRGIELEDRFRWW